MALVQNKKGGSYTKDEQDNRRNEVYRLHFEYGYSARKISDVMNINRNTINTDIDYLYSKISKNSSYLNAESFSIVTIERLDIQ